MSWKDEVEGIERRRELARAMGGEQAVARQHERGRLGIRERIDRVADPGSFYEQAPLAGHGQLGEDGELEAFTPANYVLGLARVEGRPCVLGGEDFTQRGGSPSPAGLRKSVYAETLALRHDVPLVRFLEGGGGSVTGSTGKGGGRAGGTPRPVGDPVYHPPRFRSLMEVMARVPVASAALGAVAGFPAARLAASHFSVMTRHTSQVLIGGPALVARAMGEDLSKDELGGSAVHTRSGVVDNVAEDEDAAFAQIRRFLGYLPTNVDELPPVTACADPADRCEDRLLEIIPRDRRKVYDARKLVKAVVDEGSFFEMTSNYGRSQVTGLARLEGRPVGIWANDPRFYAGAMTADGAQKVRRFVDLCDMFHVPIVALVDEPGFMIGSQSEKAATIRYGTAAIFAVQQASVPIVSVIVRKAYGVAAAAHFGPEGTVFIWPSAESGALPIEGGVAVAFRREIEAADDPVAKRAELEEAFASRRTPFPRAEGFSVHDLIDPRETRPVLCQWLAWHAPLLDKLRGPRRYSIRP